VNLVWIIEKVNPQADIFAEFSFGMRPLHDAVTARDVRFVELMLDLGVIFG